MMDVQIQEQLKVVVLQGADVIDYISTTGNAMNFGNLSDNVNEITTLGSNTRD